MRDFYRDIIAFSLLALMALITYTLSRNQTLQNDSIDQVIEARVEQEFRKRYQNAPRITIEKGTVYAGSGEIVIQDK